MRCLIQILLVIIACSGVVQADTIWWGSGEGRGLAANDVRVDSIDLANQELVYLTRAGQRTARKFDQIKQLIIDNEPAFNAAEEQFFAGEFDRAVEGYQRTLRSTTKEWLRAWSAIRLADAANRAGRFDAAVGAYVAIVRLQPDLAAKYKPQIPDSRSTFLDNAVTELNTARNQATNDAQRQQILTLLLEVHQARRDTTAANAVMEDLLKLNIGSADDPAARTALASIRISQAKNALAQNDYPRAIAVINEDRTLFVDPAEQAEAFWILAEAGYAQADRSNRTALLDAALAYMRVAAHFKDVPGRPYVGESLLRAAEIHELLGGEQVAVALSLYKQIATEFASEPAGAKARQHQQRLESSAR
ncbi:MAG TPA: hypothetical protein PKB10_01425 [Tepidisphaeraceae bacterium]|nr:hypothetical protein [Tepidisphaeraceae bacterium]